MDATDRQRGAEDEEEEDEEERRRTRTAHIKSNNPHLTGGEKHLKPPPRLDYEF